MKRTYPEDILQRQVWQYLKIQYPNMLAFHVPNGGRRDEREAAKFKSMGVIPGVSDLLLFWPGGFGAIELKAGKNKMQPTQIEFQRKWELAGGNFALCYSLDEVIAVIKSWLDEKR